MTVIANNRWRRLLAYVALAIAATIAVSGGSRAATILDQVKRQGYVQCGSVERPGLAALDDKGRWTGLTVEMCRAVATAIFGSSARIAFHAYGSDKAFDPLRRGEDQIAFLSFSEMAEHDLSGKLLPGPTVFVETHDVMVAKESRVQRLEDLQGISICFIIAGAPSDSLEAFFQGRGLAIMRFAFREDGEMYDAYRVQRCEAVVDESTALAAARTEGGVNHLASRLLPTPLAAFPIVAATPIEGDAQWAAIVADVLATLRAADVAQNTWRAGGLGLMPLGATGLGLPGTWQAAVAAATGSYDAIFRRTLGAGSPLMLEEGLNRSTSAGGLALLPLPAMNRPAMNRPAMNRPAVSPQQRPGGDPRR